MYKTALFDLDGTLTDSKPGIINCLLYAYRALNLPTPDSTLLNSFIGPPLQETCNKLGFDQDTTASFLAHYRQRFRQKGILENTLYQGMDTLLRDLKKRGVTLALATSKPLVFAREILRNYNLTRYFDFIEGATLSGSLSKKRDIIAAVIGHGISPLTAVMVGDRQYDIEGASYFGMDSIGVTFGYAEPYELQKSGATYLAGSAAEIKDIILNNRKS